MIEKTFNLICLKHFTTAIKYSRSKQHIECFQKIITVNDEILRENKTIFNLFSKIEMGCDREVLVNKSIELTNYKALQISDCIVLSVERETITDDLENVVNMYLDLLSATLTLIVEIAQACERDD